MAKDGGGDEAPISGEELRRFCDLLYRRTGLVYDERRRYYLAPRLAERMAAVGTRSFQAYLGLLRNDGAEMERLINQITVNETYFYREIDHLHCLTAHLLDAVAGRKGAGEPIRIWSVPCSTGEEPYSIAIWLLENWPGLARWDVEIVASDIDTRVLKSAQAGIYGERSVARLPPSVLVRYFEAEGAGCWRVSPELREAVRFTPVNVVDRARMASLRDVDVIFCRNLLIYFDETSRREAAANLYDCLVPGGYLFLGHSEAMSRISSLFQVCRYPEAVVYRRPPEVSHER